MRPRLRPLLFLCCAAAGWTAGCSLSHVPGALDPERAPRGEGWRRLFNGRDLSGWHALQSDRPMSWKVADGVLVNAPEGHGGVNLITDETFEDFEFYCEFRIPAGSNSGLYLRGRYEIQILDDPPDIGDLGRHGAIYGKAAPAGPVTRPAGQWQSLYARIVGRTTCVILNGRAAHCCYELPGPTGAALDENEDQPGPIMIQGDHGPIEVRHVWIRPLTGARPCPAPCCGKVPGCRKETCGRAATPTCPRRGGPCCGSCRPPGCCGNMPAAGGSGSRP